MITKDWTYDAMSPHGKSYKTMIIQYASFEAKVIHFLVKNQSFCNDFPVP